MITEQILYSTAVCRLTAIGPQLEPLLGFYSIGSGSFQRVEPTRRTVILWFLARFFPSLDAAGQKYMVGEWVESGEKSITDHHTCVYAFVPL